MKHKSQWRLETVWRWLFGFAVLVPFAQNVYSQTYAPPAAGEFGGNGPYTVAIDTFTNPTYPVANGQTLTVSIYHPSGEINPALPTIFVAHGITDPIGRAADYEALLSDLASQGYNVVFSPYEGFTSASNPDRFDELTTGFDAAVAKYDLDTERVGFAGHSFGGGLLPAVIQHEMMGLSDLYTAGHHWGGKAAFMFSMAPGYAFDGGGETGVTSSQAISFPANLNVIEQVYDDDPSIADPRLAIDIFYNISTVLSQKDFLTVYGDDHGMPAQVAGHFLPNTFFLQTSTSLQAWAVLRHLDALAAYTFTGDAVAQQIALGNGVPSETNEGVWSDGVPVRPMGVTDAPNGETYSTGPYWAQWNSPDNPRGIFPLVNSRPHLGNISTRLSVGTGDNVLIGGFIVTGTQPKKVIVRGIGPSSPVAGALADPTLELHDSSGAIIASNDNWQDSPDKQAIIDSTIPPSNDRESAIIRTLSPGTYTAIVRGVNNTTGVGLVEVYDLDSSADSKLANISTRGSVQTGDNVLIGGLIVLGDGPGKAIIRAIGPSLPVGGALADPTLELHDGNGALLGFNDNWRSNQEADIIASTLPPQSDSESAIVATLAPGLYTAIVRGAGNTIGVALVEVYQLSN